MRRKAIVAVLLGVMLGGLAAAPAQADPPKAEGYIMITPYGHRFQGWFWIDQIDGIIGCAKCLHWLQLKPQEELRVEQAAALDRGIMAGLGLLSDASITTDPRRKAALRSDALTQFTSAARALGRTGVTAGPVGWYDPDKDDTWVADAPWLTAAAQDVADGLGLIQSVLVSGDPSPDPWRQAAIQFDEAYGEIAGKKAIGG